MFFECIVESLFEFGEYEFIVFLIYCLMFSCWFIGIERDLFVVVFLIGVYEIRIRELRIFLKE